MSTTTQVEPHPRWQLGPRGRKPKWADPAVREALLDAARLGLHLKFSCRSAGISEATLLAWKRDVVLPGAPTQLVDLIDQLEEITARNVLRNAALIQHAAAQDPRQWRAAAWWLERTCPETFGKPEQRQPQQEIRPNTAVPSEADIRQLREALRSRLDGGGAHRAPSS